MKGLCICGVYETVNCRIWFGNDLLSYCHAISAKIILYEGQKQKQLFFCVALLSYTESIHSVCLLCGTDMADE